MRAGFILICCIVLWNAEVLCFLLTPRIVRPTPFAVKVNDIPSALQDSSFSKLKFNHKITHDLKLQSRKQLNSTGLAILACIKDEQRRDQFDLITISTAITYCQRTSLYSLALQLFWAIHNSPIAYDAICITAAIRAAALAADSDQLLDLLDIATKKFTKGECMQCVVAAVESLAHSVANDGQQDHALLLLLKEWAVKNGYWSSQLVLESFLLAGCRLQFTSIWRDSYYSLVNRDNCLSSRSCSILLEHFSKTTIDVEDSHTIVEKIRTQRSPRDVVLYSSLLKYYMAVRDTDRFQQTLQEMAKEVEPSVRRGDKYMQSLLQAALLGGMVSSEHLERFRSSSALFQEDNPYVLCQQVTHSTSSAAIQQILLQAEQRKISDTVLNLAAAQRLGYLHDYAGALSVLQRLCSQLNEEEVNLQPAQINNLLRVLSTVAVEAVLGTCAAETKSNFVKLFVNTIHFFSVKQEHICDAKTSFCVMSMFSRLLTCNVTSLATSSTWLSLLLWLRDRYFPQQYLPPEAVHATTTTMVQLCSQAHNKVAQDTFGDLVSEVDNSNSYLPPLQRLRNQLFLYVQFVLTENSTNQHKRWQGWNLPFLEAVLKYFIAVQGEYPREEPVHVSDFFALMRGNSVVRPNGVMLFELSRWFRNHGDIARHAALLHWMGDSPRILAPPSIINAIVAHLYSEGHKQLVLLLYQRYAATHRLRSEWSADATDGLLTLDLHYRSRGMAYVILLTSLKQIISDSLMYNQDAIRIITGKNLPNWNSTDITGNNFQARNTKSQPYRLSEEVQQILIEEFYPPIPSSTEPGNPGRILVRIEDIRKSSSLVSNAT